MMKATGTIITIVCTVVAAGLAVWLAVECQARAELERENDVLRRQLSPMDQLLADSRRLSNLVALAKAVPARVNEPVEAASAREEQAKELARLRGEVEALRQQSRELETGQVRAGRETGPRPPGAGAGGSGENAAGAEGFEILNAGYWTDRTNMDVAAELRERIRDGSLKAIASNNLKGDPEFGQVKRLTVVYRFGGAIFTNEFREGEFVQLPKEQEGR